MSKLKEILRDLVCECVQNLWLNDREIPCGTRYAIKNVNKLLNHAVMEIEKGDNIQEEK